MGGAGGQGLAGVCFTSAFRAGGMFSVRYLPESSFMVSDEHGKIIPHISLKKFLNKFEFDFKPQ